MVGQPFHPLQAIAVVDAIDRKTGLQTIEFTIVHENRELKDKKRSARRFRLHPPRRAAAWKSHFGRKSQALGVSRQLREKSAGRSRAVRDYRRANVSPALFFLLGKLIIADEHLAVPLVRSALRRVDDLDRSNRPASEQPSHFGMIVQGKQKPATDFVQALFELREVLVAEIVAVKLPPPVRRVHVEAGGGTVVPLQDLLVG